jgi:methylmalonyl-CoA mutase cobalamin-binding subunit
MTMPAGSRVDTALMMSVIPIPRNHNQPDMINGGIIPDDDIAALKKQGVESSSHPARPCRTSSTGCCKQQLSVSSS